RLMSFAALALLVGGAVFLSVCWPAGWRQRRPRRLLWAGWWSAAAAGLAGFVLQGVYAAALPISRTLDSDLLRGVATSRYGRAVELQIPVLGAAAWWLVAAGRRPPGGRRDVLGAALGVGLLACLAAQGHASGGMQAPLALVMVTLHLTAMSCWLGGLAVLAICLLPNREASELAVAVPRFSRLALAAVGLLVATGSYQIWRQVGTLPALLATPSGRLLLAKLGTFVVLVGVAAVSRSWVRRHYATGTPGSAPSDLTRLRQTVGAEVFLAVGVLAITATLVAAQPARTAYHPTVTRTVDAGLAVVRISAVPAGNRLLDLRAQTFSRGGAPFDIPELTAQLRLPARDLGPLMVQFRKVGRAQFVADQVAVPVAGQWQLRLFVLTTAVNDFPALTTIRVS
ncbi:MAG: CopD family protein, partial [Actinomycetota bacterium]|nr:CopD family protein [Actinomycetota bacterium]